MFKNILLTSCLFIGSVSNIFAGSFYVGPSLNFENIRASGNRYIGMRPMVMGGYSFWLNDWLYFAIEGFGGGKSIDINNGSKNDISLKSSYVYGVSLIPGIFLEEEFMIYGRLGYIWANFNSADTRIKGKEGGAGLDYKMMNCWSIRAEYDYVQYNSGSESLKADEINLGAIYRFSF